MTVAVISLVLLLAGSLMERVYAQRQYDAERARLVNAVVARHAGELAMLSAAPKPAKKKSEESAVPDELQMIGLAGN